MSTEKTAAFADIGMQLRRPEVSPSGRDRELRKAERLMEVHMRSGDIPAALRNVNLLIRLDPESAAHHFNRALLCQHQSQIEQAVYEFMHTIWLDPDGPYSDPARCFLEDLDMLQLNQILTLAGDDLIFRTKLSRDCLPAAIERGFALSPAGEQLLQDFCEYSLAESPAPARASRYH
jgi:hypothetical protein